MKQSIGSSIVHRLRNGVFQLQIRVPDHMQGARRKSESFLHKKITRELLGENFAIVSLWTGTPVGMS